MIKKTDVTVIICCAGMGTRLGIGTTKALVDVGGEPQITVGEGVDGLRLSLGPGGDLRHEIGAHELTP